MSTFEGRQLTWRTSDCLTEEGALGSLHHRSGLGELQPKEAHTMEGPPTQKCCEVMRHLLDYEILLVSYTDPK